MEDFQYAHSFYNLLVASKYVNKRQASNVKIILFSNQDLKNVFLILKIFQHNY